MILIKNFCDGYDRPAHYHRDTQLVTVGWRRLCPACLDAWRVDQQVRRPFVKGNLIPPTDELTEA